MREEFQFPRPPREGRHIARVEDRGRHVKASRQQVARGGAVWENAKDRGEGGVEKQNDRRREKRDGKNNKKEKWREKYIFWESEWNVISGD